MSKRIADLVVELIGAMKVELTPTGCKVEDILGYIDQGIAPVKQGFVEEVCRIDINHDNFTLVCNERLDDINTKITEACSDINDLESRIDDLEDNDDDVDVEGEIESFLDGYKGQQLISSAVSEALDKDELARDIKDDIKDDIEWLLDDDQFRATVRRVVQDEIKNALQVLVAHWADN